MEEIKFVPLFVFILFLFLVGGKVDAQISQRSYAVSPPPPNYYKQYMSHVKHTWPGIAAQFIAGSANGVADMLAHKHSQSVFNDLPEDHFFGSQSWKRKWVSGDYTKERFPGSSTVFVTFTDGWHLMNTIERTSMRVGFSFTLQDAKITWEDIVDLIAGFVAYGAGHGLTQKILLE